MRERLLRGHEYHDGDGDDGKERERKD